MSEVRERPKRIQRKRTKGWKMPPNTVYVGRPSKWGNPYFIASYTGISRDARREAVRRYRAWVYACNHLSTIDVPRIKSELSGKNLACWCPEGLPCHADVLLEIANSRAGD
jgi:uncharacterized protein DUF4326